MPKLNTANQTIPIILYLIASLLGALGQYFYKLAGLQIGSTPLFKNYFLWLGIILFIAVMGLFVSAYRLGGRMSIVYPIYATTFIWAALIAVLLGKEPWSIKQCIGIISIICGLFLITNSGVHNACIITTSSYKI